MMDGFDLLLAEYARSRGDPYRMDPYIIDENGVIIRSTEESEIGLDFREYPRFYYVDARGVQVSGREPGKNHNPL